MTGYLHIYIVHLGAAKGELRWALYSSLDAAKNIGGFHGPKQTTYEYLRCWDEDDLEAAIEQFNAIHGDA